MRSLLQLNTILIFYFVDAWMQAVEAEELWDIAMPWRNSTVLYSSDPSITFVNVAGLSRLEFELKGCEGARIVLLKEPNNFTDFLEIILGKDDNSFTQISECMNDSWCEFRSSSNANQRPMHCLIPIPFWVNFRSPTLTIGVRNDRSRNRRPVLASWTPPLFNNVGLDLISYVGFSNEEDELILVLKRDADTNFCYVQDEEATSIRQCGDNFYDRPLCGQCGCCYHEHRRPPCFHSMAHKEIQTDRCMRTIEELSDGVILLAQSPSYVSENATFLILVGTLRPNFSYMVQFEANDSEVLDDLFEPRLRIPPWAQGRRLSDWLNSLQSDLNADENTAASKEMDYFGVELSHVYSETGSFAISFSVSGQLTLRNGRENFTVQALVEIERRPTLVELINYTLLVSRSLAFSNESTEFVYLIGNSFPELSYAVDFGDGSELQVFDARRIKSLNSADLPGWLLTDGGMLSSGNLTEAERDGKAPAFLSRSIHHLLLFDHVYLKPGNYVITVNVSGFIPTINKPVQHITNLVIDVQRRPRLTELVDGLVFVASSPAYDGEALSVAVLVENEHPSLSAVVEFGDDSDCITVHLSQSVSAASWLSEGNMHQAHGMNDTQVKDFLNSTTMFVGHEFSHTYRTIGTYNVIVVISGDQPVVLKSDNIRMAAEITVKKRPTLSQAIGHSVLLIDSPVYVNESTTFLIGTEYFYPELTYTLNFGDSSSHNLFKTNQTQSLFDWSRNGYKISDHVDILIGGDVSGFRLETVRHVYRSPGNYHALLYVTGVLKVVQKYDTVFKGQAVDVQRRPTLSEIVRNDVVMVTKNRVYLNQDVEVFLLLPSNLSNLSYAVDCGVRMADKAMNTKPLMKLPDWITDGKDVITNLPNTLQLNSFLFSTESFFSAANSCRYKKLDNYSITLIVSGKDERVGKVDFHRIGLFIPVSVISRPTLSQEIGRLWLFVRRPVYVSEETNCIVAVEKYFPTLKYSLSAGREALSAKRELVFRQNVSFPDWIEKRNYYTSGSFQNVIIPSYAYWTETNVTFLKAEAFAVTFNISGKLESVDRLESVIRSTQVVAIEILKLSELLKDKCQIMNTSLSVVEQIVGFVFLCHRIDHQEHLNFMVNFGDSSSEERLMMSSRFLLPNWLSRNGEPIFRNLANERNGTRSTETHEYNGAAFYRVYHSTGKKELRISVRAEGGFRVKNSTEVVIIKHLALVGPSPIQEKPPEAKCRPHSVSIRGGGGISFDLPGKFSRNASIRLEAVTHSDCLEVEEGAFVWEIEGGGGHSKNSRPLDSSAKRKLTLDAYSLNYGKYKIIVKVITGNYSFSDRTVSAETWISIEPSPLHVELLGGPVLLTDYFSHVKMTAVHYQDVDEHPNIRSSDPVFTWFCTGLNEELPQEPLNRKYHGSDGGCYGNGLLIAKGTSPSLIFRPHKSIFRSLPAFFVVQLFISKPSRAPASSQQAVVVLQKGPPSIRIVCLSNCAEFLNIDERLVLNATCLDCSSVERLEFLWEVESACHQNVIKESDWKRNDSSRDTYNQLVVDPGVFFASAGADLQYRLKVTATRQEKSQASAVYIVQTRSSPHGNPPSKLWKDAAAEAALRILVVSDGRWATTPSCPPFLLLLLLFLAYGL